MRAMMVVYASIILSALGSHPAWAESEFQSATTDAAPDVVSSPVEVPSEVRLHDSKVARSMRDAGIAMSVVGTTMAATGGGLLGGYFRDTRRDELALSGSLLVGFGAPVLFAGVPLAAVGGWAERRLADPNLDIEAATRTARRIRNAGIGVTTIAIAGGVAALVSLAIPPPPQPAGSEGPPGNFVMAGFVFSAAVGLASVGIPLWAGGSWAARRFQRTNAPIRVSFSAAPTRDGASAQLNFTF